MIRSTHWQTPALLTFLFLAFGCTGDPQAASVPKQNLQGAAAVDPIVELEDRVQAQPVEAPSIAPERWAALKQEIRETFPRAQQLPAADLKAWLSGNKPAPLLLDVRQAAEFDVSHLEHAQRAIDLDAALQILGNSPLDQPVVLYCSVGYRSSALVEKLMDRGYTNLFNLEGSIFEWANRGAPVVVDGTPIERVHPYDGNWGQLLRRDYWSEFDDANSNETK